MARMRGALAAALAVTCFLPVHCQVAIPSSVSGDQCRPYVDLNHFLPGDNLSVMRQAIANACAANLSLPDPGDVGFTLFATLNSGFVTQSGVRGQAAQALNSTAQQSQQFTSWLLYSMLPAAHTLPELRQQEQLPTELQYVQHNNPAYALRVSSSTGQTQLTDILATAGGTVAPVSILGSYQVCNAVVHITDGMLWPSFSTNSATLPVTMPLAMPYIPDNWISGPLPQPLCIPGNTPVLSSSADGTARIGQLLQGLLTPLLGNTSASTDAPALDGIACLPTLPGLPPQLGASTPAASPAPVTAAPTPQQAHSSTAAIVGGVVGGVAGAVLLAALAIFLLWTRRRNNANGSYRLDVEESVPVGSAESYDRTTQHRPISGLKALDSASSVYNNDAQETKLTARRAGAGDQQWEIDPGDVMICHDTSGKEVVLGAGGFGTVFKAVLDGSTIVAVKFVQGQSSKEQQRFEREVAILKGLRHTNIVQFLGASIVHGQIMLVTEFMVRGDLWNALSHYHNHVLSWYKRGKAVALDTVRGLQHMHSRDIAHFDLKSANVLLAKDGTAKVADVGLAKILTREHTMVSSETTFDWAAPEVLGGGECNEKADIWSLGVLLWEICSGERPHLRQLRPLRCPEECPQYVADVIARCRQQDSAARPSARTVYEWLSSPPSQDLSSAPGGDASGISPAALPPPDPHQANQQQVAAAPALARKQAEAHPKDEHGRNERPATEGSSPEDSLANTRDALLHSSPRPRASPRSGTSVPEESAGIAHAHACTAVPSQDDGTGHHSTATAAAQHGQSHASASNPAPSSFGFASPFANAGAHIP